MSIAKVDNTMFFQKVCQLEITKASPKQPQSETGSAIAIQSVSGVMKPIMSNDRMEVDLMLVPNRRQTPKVNSNVANAIPITNAIGAKKSSPMADK